MRYTLATWLTSPFKDPRPRVADGSPIYFGSFGEVYFPDHDLRGTLLADLRLATRAEFGFPQPATNS